MLGVSSIRMSNQYNFPANGSIAVFIAALRGLQTLDFKKCHTYILNMYWYIKTVFKCFRKKSAYPAF